MSLTVSDVGIALIKKWEGCKLTAYQDSAGVWTIGYGHTAGVTKGMTITQAQADAYLKSDCSTAEKAVNKYYSTYKWNQNQFDALVSFAYNIGNINQLTANGTRTIAVISTKILEYNKAGGKVLTGLTNRRKDEKTLFDTAVTTSVKNGATEVIATDKAKHFDSSLSGTYKTTASSGLNVRHGAGTSKEKMCTLPYGTKVKNYGFYSISNSVKWLYLRFTYAGVTYEGYASSKYLKKVYNE